MFCAAGRMQPTDALCEVCERSMIARIDEPATTICESCEADEDLFLRAGKQYEVTN